MPAALAGGRRWTVLIPAYNEAGTIRSVVEAVLGHVDDVIVIDDGSSDGTGAALAGLPVRVVRHEENRGKGQRLAEGLVLAAEAGADGILTLDADGQHDPNDIPRFIAAARAAPGAIVMGDRFHDRGSIPKKRLAAIRFGDFFISWAAARRIRDAQCGMRLYPSSLLRRVAFDEGERAHFVFETAILLRAAAAGYGFARVPIAARYAGFQQRPSHFRPIVDTCRIVVYVTGFLVRARLRGRGLLIALGVMR